jgi:hypothetical protein
MLNRIVPLAAFLLIVLSAAQGSPPATTDEVETIACRTLETHADDEMKVTAILFHQRDEASRQQVASFLREHSDQAVEVQTADGAWRRARLARLKSCFGRGLLLMATPAPLSQRGEFLLRLPRGK